LAFDEHVSLFDCAIPVVSEDEPDGQPVAYVAAQPVPFQRELEQHRKHLEALLAQMEPCPVLEDPACCQVDFEAAEGQRGRHGLLSGLRAVRARMICPRVVVNRKPLCFQ
jgi:hypothetical protein